MVRAKRYLLKHIAVALSGSAADLGQLETAAQLAEQNRAEVTGLFIEDTDLLHAANNPLAIELCRTTNTVRRVQYSAVQQQMLERASAAEKSLALSARNRGVKWTFSKVRQQEYSAIVETAHRVDVTMLAGGSIAARYESEQQARQAASRTDRGAVVVVFDRSAAAQRGLELGIRLARLRGTLLSILVVGRTQPGIDKLEQIVLGLDSYHEFSMHALYKPEFREIIAVTRGERPGAFVVPIGALEVSPERIEFIQASLRCPVFIVS